MIDNFSEIVFFNEAWVNFGKENHCFIDSDWEQVNYISECYKAANNGDAFGEEAAKVIRSIIDGRNKQFYFEYPWI